MHKARHAKNFRHMLIETCGCAMPFETDDQQTRWRPLGVSGARDHFWHSAVFVNKNGRAHIRIVWWYFTQFKCEAKAFQHFLAAASLARVGNMRGNTPSNFVDAGLQFSNISLSRATKCIKYYGHLTSI